MDAKAAKQAAVEIFCETCTHKETPKNEEPCLICIENERCDDSVTESQYEPE